VISARRGRTLPAFASSLKKQRGRSHVLYVDARARNRPDEEARRRRRKHGSASPRQPVERLDRERLASIAANTSVADGGTAWCGPAVTSAHFLTTVKVAATVALSLPSLAVNVSVYEPTSLRFTLVLYDCVNVSPGASVTTCVCE
jgi:hypothetical protein